MKLAKNKQDQDINNTIDPQLKNIIVEFLKPLDTELFESKYLISEQRFKYYIYARDPYTLSIQLTNLLYRSYSKFIITRTVLYGKEYAINIKNVDYILITRFVPMQEGCYTIPDSINKAIVMKLMYNVNQYTNMTVENYKDTIEDFTTECEDHIHKLKGVKPLNIRMSELKNTILNKFYSFMRKELKTDVLSLSYIDDIRNDAKTIYAKHSMDLLYKDPLIKDKIITKFTDIVKKISGGKQNKHTKHSDKYHIKDGSIKIFVNTHFSFYIPMDYRLKKISIYVKQGGKNIYLANLYNSATYEILPVLTGDFGIIPSHLVILRFMYLNLYFSESNDSCALYLLNNLLDVIKKCDPTNELKSNLNWFGYIVDENYQKIRYNLMDKHDTSRYIPAQYFSINNELIEV